MRGRGGPMGGPPRGGPGGPRGGPRGGFRGNGGPMRGGGDRGGRSFPPGPQGPGPHPVPTIETRGTPPASKNLLLDLTDKRVTLGQVLTYFFIFRLG